MALFWDLPVLPRAYVENLKAGRAHLPALPCAYMERFKTRRATAEAPRVQNRGVFQEAGYVKTLCLLTLR